jgi:hypothetical protein
MQSTAWPKAIHAAPGGSESAGALLNRIEAHRETVKSPVIAAPMRLSLPASLVLVVIGAPHETTHQARPRLLSRLYS